jgi:hypothetical protein
LIATHAGAENTSRAHAEVVMQIHQRAGIKSVHLGIHAVLPIHRRPAAPRRRLPAPVVASDRRQQFEQQRYLAGIRREFSAWPTLCLTAAQARRLFGLPDGACRRLLAVLVDSGFLALTRDGQYRRATGFD